MDISLVILTFNRAERCVSSVLQHACLLEGLSAEILVINNGQEVVDLPVQQAGVPIRVHVMAENRGAEARNEAISLAKGAILLYMDDDAFVQRHHVEELIAVFKAHPGTGAVAFRIFNGTRQEASLLPTVFHGCAVGISKKALALAGGYPSGYRYYAEEYHVAFRLMQVGYCLRFLDVSPHVQHVRDASGRSKAHILQRLVVNNTRLLTSFLPWRYWGGAMCDMLQRYRLVAAKEAVRIGFWRGLLAFPRSFARGVRERTPLSDILFAEVALLPQLERAAVFLGEMEQKQVVLCGCGRFPRLWIDFLQKRGIKVLAILDTNPCWKQQRIADVPVFGGLETLDFGSFVIVHGLSSFAETDYWNDLLLADPSWRVLVGKKGHTREKDAAKSGALLSEKCVITLFYRAK